MKITQLNHVAVHVADLERSRRFYREVLGLEEVTRPQFSFPGAWFRVADGQELHLIGGEVEKALPPRERHTALRVDDVDAFVRHLAKSGVEVVGPAHRPDGMRQLFLRDPDGHVFELCGR